MEQEALLNFSAFPIFSSLVSPSTQTCVDGETGESREEKKKLGGSFFSPATLEEKKANKKEAGISSSTLSNFFLLKKPISEGGAATTAKIGSYAGIAKGPESEQTVEKFLFNHLKHKAIGGVRLEAKGRLTRRFTASRSVFKVK